jgi:hypothetical protein
VGHAIESRLLVIARRTAPYSAFNVSDDETRLNLEALREVSIPAVARLMRHKDGGGLLLKKDTQGFEEEGLTITM